MSAVIRSMGVKVGRTVEDLFRGNIRGRDSDLTVNQMELVLLASIAASLEEIVRLLRNPPEPSRDRSTT